MWSKEVETLEDRESFYAEINGHGKSLVNGGNPDKLINHTVEIKYGLITEFIGFEKEGHLSRF